MRSYAEKSGWDVVLLSEVRAGRKGLVWLGQDERLVEISHSERAAGEALKKEGRGRSGMRGT